MSCATLSQPVPSAAGADAQPMDTLDDTPADREPANVEQPPPHTRTPAAQVGCCVCRSRSRQYADCVSLSWLYCHMKLLGDRGRRYRLATMPQEQRQEQPIHHSAGLPNPELVPSG